MADGSDRAPFDIEAERTNMTLLRHLQWQPDGFSLVFVFADVGTARELRRWLDERLTLDRRELQVHEATREFFAVPADAIERIMAIATEANPDRGAVWLELQRDPVDADANDVRRQILGRLNERRFVLERDVRVPLVITLPTGFRTEVARIAPDIWHIRALGLTPDRSVPDTTRDERPAAPPDETARHDRSPRGGSMHDKDEHDGAGYRAALADWQRVIDRSEEGEAYLPTAFAAIRGLVAAGELDEAERVASRALAIARRRTEHGDENASALRDLSVALDEFGDLVRARGDLDAAEHAFAESLALARGLIERGGETPAALRDLSVSLDNTGDLARARGDLDAAERAFAESLALHRRLIERGGETPAALRDFSVSLNNIGDLARARGDLDAAERAFAESLALRRRLIERGGETLGALRDLSVSLGRTGNLARARGDLDAAEHAFAESLALHRRVIERSGETPAALRDLSISLAQLGELRADARLQADALEVAERLVDLAPEDERPRELRDAIRRLRSAVDRDESGES